jgi:AsmA protein
MRCWNSQGRMPPPDCERRIVRQRSIALPQFTYSAEWQRFCDSGPNMRAVKIVVFVAGALLALILLAGLAVVLFVDPNDYRAQIEQRVTQATGRPLKIGGQLHLKLFPWIALEVNDVALGNPPGYGSKPFLTVKRADVGVKLMPLLRKQIEVRRVTLESPTVELISRRENDNNWKDLIEDDKPREPSEGSAARATIAGVDVSQATLIYRDEEKKSLTRLTQLELHTGALGGNAAVPLQAQFDYDDGTPAESRMHVVAEAKVRMPQDTSRVEVKELVVKTGELAIRSPELLLDMDAETLAPASFEIRYGELPIRATAAGEKLFSDRVVVGKISTDRVSLRKLMPTFDLKVPLTRDPDALNAFAFTSDYQLTEKALRLHGLEVTLDATRMRGKLSVEDLDTKAVAFDLNVDSIDVDRYREPEVKAEGTAKAPAPPTELPLEVLREINAQGNLRIRHAQLAGLKFDDVLVPVNAANGRIAVKPKARMFGGTYSGDIALDARAPKAKLSLNEKVRGIDIGALVNGAFKTKRVVGYGDANAALTGTGNTDAAILKSLAGKIDANVKNGAFNGVDLWYELRRAVALVKRTPLPSRTEPVRTQFKTFAGSATLANGVVRNDDLNVDMDYVKARGKGTLNITSQAIDYRLAAEVYKIPPEGAGGEMADLKALEIPIAVTGTLADMKVRPDVADLIKARLRKEVDKHLDKKKDELKKKLGDKLQDILGR